MKSYTSTFAPSERALSVLRKGRILAEDETPQQMIERVVQTLVSVENRYGIPAADQQAFAHELGTLLDSRSFVMSTPVMTNAGRYTSRPLAACTVPAVNLRTDDRAHLARVITSMHEEGMGTGFSLDDVPDPVRMLQVLNEIAIVSASSGKEDRPVGNMATLTVRHPRILEFIQAKVGSDERQEVWKFNISVSCDEAFFMNVEHGEDVVMLDGSRQSAAAIFAAIAQAAHACADPGLAFVDRMERDNPTPCVGHYTTTAPCAEVGLTPGESCQFGYINLAKFVTGGTLDVPALRRGVHLMTRALDNALDVSIGNYSNEMNRHIMTLKRKIGIGICGLADLFVKLGIRYSSNEARQMALDIVALISYESKVASYELAKVRGSYGAMTTMHGNRHVESPSFIDARYGSLTSALVSTDDWNQLSERIRTERMLRNASTTALPPTGRSGLVIDASTGIEPIFSADDYRRLHPELSDVEQSVIETATQIAPMDHLLMAAWIQLGVDESISKTINVPHHTTPEEIQNMYLAAWTQGLKGISIYRDGSRVFQPRRL